MIHNADYISEVINPALVHRCARETGSTTSGVSGTVILLTIRKGCWGKPLQAVAEMLILKNLILRYREEEQWK